MTNRQLLTLIVSVVGCAVALGILIVSLFTALQTSFEFSLESSHASLQSSLESSHASLRSALESSHASLRSALESSHASLQSSIDALESVQEILLNNQSAMQRSIVDLQDGLADLRERVARIEGLLEGLARPQPEPAQDSGQ